MRISDRMERMTDRVVKITDRKAGRPANDAGAPYRPPQLNLLREVKVDSPIHRLWAGTKILAVAGISLTLSYFPTWGALGIVLALLLGGAFLGRIPGGAWPRVPGWFWVIILITGALAAFSGGSPHWRVAGVDLGLGGIDAYLKFMGVGIILFLAAAVLGWTTPLADLAPAIAQILWPLRLLRVPVEEIAATIALCVRSLPMMVQEIRTLVAARRLRPARNLPGRSEIEHALDGLVDLLVAAMAVSVRRAGELAEAISARGGARTVGVQRHRPGWTDVVAMVVVAGACYAATLTPG